MNTIDLLQETTLALLSNKARSGLTILGIIIGIGSVIAMVSIGQGAQISIEKNIQAIGSNLIIIMPGFQRNIGSVVNTGRGSAQSLTQEDAEAILQQVSLVKAVAPELSGRYQVSIKGKNTNTSIVGATADYPQVRNLKVNEGSFFSKQQVESLARVAVLGPTVKADLFGEEADIINKTIRIKNIEFKIIGVTESKGGSGFANQDDRIFVPLTVAQRFLSGSNYLSAINVEAADQNSMSQIQEEITNLLLTRHKISDINLADFSIMNQSDLVASASSISNTLTLLLGSIAGISLIVGGIGIMNMMLTTVTERTKEIGLRKALGAKKRDISQQFLVEAIALTFIGGLIGIFLGWLASLLIAYFGNISTSVSFFSVCLAFGVSAIIGVIFGYYPAWRAASLNPIEALRYE